MLTRDDIIRMAREAGAMFRADTIIVGAKDADDFVMALAATAYAAGQAAEREACAKVCEDIEQERYALFKGRPPYTGREDGRADHYVNGESDGAGRCAAAIRARSEEGGE